jgi:hypothetical protein
LVLYLTIGGLTLITLFAFRGSMRNKN